METKTFMGNPCKRGHSGERYISDGHCVECGREKQRARYAKNPEKMREQNNAQYAKNQEKILGQQRARYAKNPEKMREQNNAQYAKKLHELFKPTRPAPSTCECCGRIPQVMCLEHCHVSGMFRGWCCGPCNAAIGLLGDDIEGLMNAVRYLERATSTTIQ